MPSAVPHMPADDLLAALATRFGFMAGALAAMNPKRVASAASRSSAGICGTALGIENTTANQPFARVLGILIEPARGAAEAKCITPLVHVAAHACRAHIRQRLRQYDLQIANGAFFRVIAPCIGIQSGPAFRRHANEMRAFVQHGMHGRIEAGENLGTNQARLALAPV